MTESTVRFALPLILPGQAQKELYHNEALTTLDGALHPVAEAMGDDVPPASPDPGEAWIVGSAPTGDWSGHADALALWTEGGWRFLDPTEGFSLWLRNEQVYARWTGSAWVAGEVVGESVKISGAQVVGPREPAISDVAGGSIVDAEARGAIGAILQVLRNHGLIET